MADEFPQVDGVEHRFVSANGVRLHVAEAGAADATPVLLLHGWPQHWYMWRNVIADLRSEYRLIAPDLRGFGWSAAPGYGYDPETFVADQIALLDELAIPRVCVIGHDWGGYTSFLLGTRHPDRIAAILALNTPHPWPRVSPQLLLDAWRSWYAFAIATPGLGRLALQGRLPKLILSRGNVNNPFSFAELDIYLERLREPARRHATISLYRYYRRAFLRALRGGPTEPALAVPARLVFGERDLYVSPKLLPGWEAHADRMGVELVPDCGHFMVNEKPELVIERARSVLRIKAETPRRSGTA